MLAGDRKGLRTALTRGTRDSFSLVSTSITSWSEAASLTGFQPLVVDTSTAESRQ
jgi:hypothetical protein